MVKCVDCEFLGFGNWCTYWEATVKKVDKDVPCSHFKCKPVSEEEVSVSILQIKGGRFEVIKPRDNDDVMSGYFSPRWISPYLIASIRLVGDISLAFDLLWKDLKKR